MADPYEADFCGDRLRLSAFLRVVGDGMPQRPTRFKRRLRHSHHFSEGLGQDYSDRNGERANPTQKSTREGHSNDKFIIEASRSSKPKLNTLRSEHRPQAPALNNGNEHTRGRLEDSQPTDTEEQAVKLTSITAVTRSPTKPHTVPQIRNRRRLPVNQLALLRTTSSDGLPQPSTYHVPAMPVAATEAIEDSQVQALSRVPSKRKAPERPLTQRVQKPAPTTNAIAPAQMFRGPFTQFRFAQLSGAHSRRSSIATCSDGFVGEELSVQVTKRPLTPQNSSAGRTKRVALNRRGLFLSQGSLPEPSLGPSGDTVMMEDWPTNTEVRMSARTPSCTEEALHCL
ncbi:hypothetical protein C7974DRAFT_72912 [Boeremia exigua]|uniref:uncharacterized protein n=1 Tax=Boeremia exigua TaxID=749465 RepID=UPI001E8D95EE|nr:uncharacterized protein C7974DRAFT_72912 [Boeremia exigua]KAH6614218.1 hypothetical protein C7974DRAFT_72912 [Boeremia exigua]